MILCVCFTLGCGRKKPQPPSDTEQQANKLRLEGQRALLTGETDEAGNLLDQALALASDNAHLQLERADIYAIQGQHQQAAATYSKAQHLAKADGLPGGMPEASLGSALVHQAMGDSLIYENKLKLAREGFETRLEHLGKVQEEGRKNGDDKPMLLTQDQVKAMANLAYIQALQGDPQGGLEKAQDLLKKSPGNRLVEDMIQAIRQNLDGTSLPTELSR